MIYIVKQIERSQVFQEYTFEKIVNQDWIDWLYSNTNMDIITYEEYDKERERENNPVHDL